MRKIVLKPHAEASISKVAEWLASEYLPTTGIKFLDDLEKFLSRHALLISMKFPPCKSKRLKELGYSCLIYKHNWVIAFKYTKQTFVVHEFIWGGKLND